MNDSEDIQRLIRLKKYETPGDEYFETFLEDFKDRQRSELLRQSARGLLMERVSMWFDEISGPRWLVPAGVSTAAAAALALGLYAVRPPVSEDAGPDLASAPTAPLTPTTPSPAALPTDAATLPGESVITLQLPRRDQRVPALGLDGTRPADASGVLPTSARGPFREL